MFSVWGRLVSSRPDGTHHTLISAWCKLLSLSQDDPQKPKARGEPGPGISLLLNPSLTYGWLNLGSYHQGSQRSPGLQEYQEATNRLADASQDVPKAPEHVDDGIHVSAIARTASDDNLPQVLTIHL